jgi:hypothetical protein
MRGADIRLASLTKAKRRLQLNGSEPAVLQMPSVAEERRKFERNMRRHDFEKNLKDRYRSVRINLYAQPIDPDQELAGTGGAIGLLRHQPRPPLQCFASPLGAILLGDAW